ncbi:MAG: hypothetical protein P4M07_19440 [Xanthobacteraceae bacterium]|nr:hypothetical protein [Xanthobacteraceae bacterium]
MAVPREPGDPVRRGWSEDDRLLHASMADELPPRQSIPDDLEGPPQADPEMAEAPAGPGRIATYAVAALLVVFAVLYGMTQNSPIASNPPASNTAANTQASPPVRNVTPGPNTQPGATTGAAPSKPAQAPAPTTPGAAGPGTTTR